MNVGGLGNKLNRLGASKRGFQAQLSWTTTETGVFTGTVRMTEGNMKVNWGDGTSEIIADGSDNLSHDYGGVSGDKKVIVTFLKGYKDVTEIDISSTNSKGDLSNWNVSGLTSLSSFRLNDNSFTGDLSGWDISGLTNLSYFYIFDNSFTGDLSGWDISGLINLSYFYIFINSFTGDLSGWDISGLTNLVDFYIRNNLFTGDLSSWDISGLTNLNYFNVCNNWFTGDLSGWDISGLTSLQRFYIYKNSFSGTPVLTTNAGFADGIDIQIQTNTGIPNTNVSNHIIGLDDYDGSNGSLDASGTNGGSMTYSDLTAAAQTAHDNLIDTKGWTITLDT